MSRSELIDTYPDFLKYWDGAHDQPVADQIESWSSEYMSRFPELLKKQIEDYSEQDLDWRKIAEEKVFPFLNDRLPVMREARKNLLELCPAIYSKAQELLGFEADVSFVIYVGVGCGAGWVTSYGDQPAILFGLENIAGSGWGSVNSVAKDVIFRILRRDIAGAPPRKAPNGQEVGATLGLLRSLLMLLTPFQPIIAGNCFMP